MTWPAILWLAAGAYAFKAAGVLVLGSDQVGSRLRPLTSLVPAALFTGLVVALTLGDEPLLASRLAGVTAAGIAAWRKAPFIVVVGVAMLTTALLRLL